MPAISATAAVLPMFMPVNTVMPSVMKNFVPIGPLVGTTILIFPILFFAGYLVSKNLVPRGKNIACLFWKDRL